MAFGFCFLWLLFFVFVYFLSFFVLLFLVCLCIFSPVLLSFSGFSLFFFFFSKFYSSRQFLPFELPRTLVIFLWEFFHRCALVFASVISHLVFIYFPYLN